MRIDIITLLPKLLDGALSESIIKRAQDKGLVEIHIHNLRDYCEDKHRTADDYPFGGEAGMVMKVEPIYKIITQLRSEREYDEVIYTSPDGITYNQQEANRLSTLGNLIILCGHYKGVDYRVREHLITREISIGDYVLTGGELPAMVMVDAVARLVPGVLHNDESATTESFHNDLLEYPQYSRPEVWRDKKVPEILLSGNHAKVDEWRLAQSIERTKRLRPDLYEKWAKRQEDEGSKK